MFDKTGTLTHDAPQVAQIIPFGGSKALIGSRHFIFEDEKCTIPENDTAFVEKAKAEGHKVVMIGDGINDSPTLSAADVGIAISDGAAIAREVADITIGADDLFELVVLKMLANGLAGRIHGNYRFVIGFNSGLISLGALGILPPATSALLYPKPL